MIWKVPGGSREDLKVLEFSRKYRKCVEHLGKFQNIIEGYEELQKAPEGSRVIERVLEDYGTHESLWKLTEDPKCSRIF